MIRNTAIEAPERMKFIQKWSENSQLSNDPILKEYNIDIDLKMIDLNGRVLDPPNIGYKETSPNQAIVASEQIGSIGSWNHFVFDNRKKTFLQFKESISLNRWAIINISQCNRNIVDEFHFKLQETGKKHGMVIKDMLDYKESQDGCINMDFKELINMHKNLELVLVIMKDLNNSAYGQIKTLGDLDYGIMTQVVKEKNILTMNDQKITNILLKVNCKLGGKNFILADTIRYHFDKKLKCLFILLSDEFKNILKFYYFLEF